MVMNYKIVAGYSQMETNRITFLDILQTLAAFVAVPVVLLYPVGFFALFAQFMNYFYLDVYTAWYATSLVNRMIAIEQGVTILALALGASVVLSGIIARLLLAHDEGNVPKPPTVFAKLKAVLTLRGFEHRGALSAELIGISLLILFLYSAYSRVVAGGRPSWFHLRGRLSTECSEEQIARHQSELWPDSLVPASIILVGCLWGGWLIYSSYQAYRRRTNVGRLPGTVIATERRLGKVIFDSVTEGWILSGLAIAYTFGVIASMVLAWNTPSVVPPMTYGPTVEHRGKPKPTESAFLSHSEGQWYFLHRIPNDDGDNPKTKKPPDYTIVSLREGEVKYVRVRPIPPRVARVAPLLGGFGEPQLKKHCKSKKDE
jgi:hypothetical protein